MNTTTQLWATLASAMGAIAFLQALLGSLLPPELGQQFRILLSSLFSSFSSHCYYDIAETDGLFNTNELYSAVQLYLSHGPAMLSGNRVSLSRTLNSSSFTLGLPASDRLVDSFQGVTTVWEHVVATRDPQPFSWRPRSEQERSFVLRIPKKHRGVFLHSYLDHIIEVADGIRRSTRDRRLHTHSNDRGAIHWEAVPFKHPSTFETLALDADTKQTIMADLRNFTDGEAFFRKTGRAWKRGYLLYGPPGTGKSSMIAAMANFLSYDVYYLELSEVQTNSDLRGLLMNTSSKSIVVIEDIDCSLSLVTDRSPKRHPIRGGPGGGRQDHPAHEADDQEPSGGPPEEVKSKVTLSGLLNFTDGLWSCCGSERIFVFTTNHIEKLDPALLRSGRMDMHIHMGHCSPEAIKVLLRNYLDVDGRDERVAEMAGVVADAQMTPAEISELLIRNRRDSNKALEETWPSSTSVRGEEFESRGFFSSFTRPLSFALPSFPIHGTFPKPIQASLRPSSPHPPRRRSLLPRSAQWRRLRRRPVRVVLHPGQTAFRLLCPSALVGGVIGKSGSIIQLIRQETGALIRFEEAVDGSDERVILIVADGKNKDADSGVSVAQDTLLRILDRILEVDKEKPTGKSVTCRMLASSGQVGALMGKGGVVISGIRKESGAEIRVLPRKQIPSCASATDDLIQIIGDAVAVKKALVSVSRCLQDNPPSDKLQMVGSKPVGSHPRESFLEMQEPLYKSTSHPRASFPEMQEPLYKSSFSMASLPSPGPYSIASDFTRGPSSRLEGIDALSSLSKNSLQEVSFKLVCSDTMVGGVIGKGGTIVKALETETGASISVTPRLKDCEDRVITVSATEYPESRYSHAQNALVRVYARSVEASSEKGLGLGQERSDSVSARVLVPADQIGCLLGKGGTIIADMRKTTGANIRIIRQDELPKCALENEELVQITGSYQSVWDALLLVTTRLRDNMFAARLHVSRSVPLSSAVSDSPTTYGVVREVLGPGPYEPYNHEILTPVAYGSPNVRRNPSLSLGFDRVSSFSTDQVSLPSSDTGGLSHSFIRSSSPSSWRSQRFPIGSHGNSADIGRGLSTGRIDFGSASKSAIVTNSTIEISVPDSVFGSVHGENGSDLDIIRQVSGAKVVAHHPLPGATSGTMIISGTPEQTQAAQNLVQAFILSGSAKAGLRQL